MKMRFSARLAGCSMLLALLAGCMSSDPAPSKAPQAFSKQMEETYAKPASTVQVASKLAQAAADGFNGHGWYWDPSAPGTGFMFEAQADTGFVAFFMYDDTGKPIWYAASGAFTVTGANTYRFSGMLQRYQGGQSVGSSTPSVPTAVDVGNVTLNFTGGAAPMTYNVSAQLPGRTMNAQRFDYAGVTVTPGAYQTETGWYWNPSQSGRGYAIEIQNNKVFMAMFHYNPDGSPTWGIVQGTSAQSGTFSGPIVGYTGGQTLSGAYRPATEGAPATTFNVTTSSACAGTLAFGNGLTTAIQRFAFGVQSSSGEQCRQNKVNTQFTGPGFWTIGAQCAAPRTGLDPYNGNRPYPDAQGTLDNEKTWVKAFMDQIYLWYKETPTNVNPSTYTAAAQGTNARAVDAYFKALMTPTLTQSGARTDKFSFTTDTATWNASSQAGTTTGYGIRFINLGSSPPRNFRVAYVEPNSPAANGGLRRGDRLITLDGVDFVNGNDVTSLNRSLSPSGVYTTNWQVQGVDGTQRSITMTSSAAVLTSPVHEVRTLDVDGKKVGFLSLNTFNNNSAERQLVDAINTLKTAGVTELVLDLRYNGGGYVTISNMLSYMIGGDRVRGKLFNRYACNDRNLFSICGYADGFKDTTSGFSISAGQALPTLNLSRVFVLQTASTCSASESLTNGLAPFMDVIKLGSTSCGKPYGFYAWDNCGVTYAAMMFKSTNAAGFGEFGDGIAQNCQVADDLSKARGDAQELMTAGAIEYIRNGRCPAATTGVRKPGQVPFDAKVIAEPWETVQFLGSPSDPVKPVPSKLLNQLAR